MQTKSRDAITYSELAWVLKVFPSDGPLYLEHWHFDYAQWETMGKADIKIHAEEDRIFIKRKDLRCTGFGHELHLAEQARSWSVRGLGECEMPSDRLGQPTPGVQLVAAWGEVRRVRLARL